MLKYIIFISYIYSLSFNVVIDIFDLWTLFPNVKFNDFIFWYNYSIFFQNQHIYMNISIKNFFFMCLDLICQMFLRWQAFS
jgi:hypothetical protein